MRVSDAEISRIAAYLGMDEDEFIANETELAPDRRGLVLKSKADGACVYLDENNLCRLNPVKPDKCRSFPFEWTNPDSSAVCPELAGAFVGYGGGIKNKVVLLESERHSPEGESMT